MTFQMNPKKVLSSFMAGGESCNACNACFTVYKKRSKDI